MAATDVLAALLQAADTRAEARALIDSLSEEFFHISSTYLEMVRPSRCVLDFAARAGVAILCVIFFNTFRWVVSSRRVMSEADLLRYCCNICYIF